jgi:iron-sulfur cluster insertion protein
MLLPLDFWAPELIEQWHELAQRNPPAEAAPIPTQNTQGRYAGNKPGYDPYLDDNAGSSSYGYRENDNPGRFGTPSQTVSREAAYGQAQPQPQPIASLARGYDNPQIHAQAVAQAHAQAHAQALAQAQAAASPEEAFAHNPLRLTSTAAAVLKLMLRQQGFTTGKVRVSVSGRGCQIDFTDEEPNPQQDFMYACDGVTILVDRDSASVLTGVQMDLPPSPQSMGFVFSRVA